jgi:preprotein translocase subunit YajC
MNMLSILLQASAPGQSGGLGQFLPLMLIMVVFFFFMIWPQMRKQKKAKAYLAELKKGDHVVTTGGFHAKIAQITDTHFILDLEEGKIKAEKAAVSMEMTMTAYPKPKA